MGLSAEKVRGTILGSNGRSPVEGALPRSGSIGLQRMLWLVWFATGGQRPDLGDGAPTCVRGRPVNSDAAVVLGVTLQKRPPRGGGPGAARRCRAGITPLFPIASYSAYPIDQVHS